MIEKRQTLMIDRKLQLRMIGLIVVFGALISLISLLALQLLSQRIFTLASQAEIPLETRMLLMRELSQTTLVLILFMALSLAVSWLVGLYFSHRIAGPIRNMQNTLDAYLKGDSQARVRLRKTDHFEELAEKINQTLNHKSPPPAHLSNDSR
jgi:hypothetical protein